MSFTTEEVQALLAKYEQLKVTILEIDHKYSLNYQEPQLNLPPTLGLEKLIFTPLAEAEITAIAQAEVLPSHTNKTRALEQNYLKALQNLQTKRSNVDEQLRQKLQKLLADYNTQVKTLKRRLVNNGLIFSSVVTKANEDVLAEYNRQVTEASTHHQTQVSDVTAEQTALQSRYDEATVSLEREYQTRLTDAKNDVQYKQLKDKERIDKYNQALEEKEVKYQASIERTKEYARQAEMERSLNAARLYAELGESGVQSQKIYEKYAYCQKFFATWKKDEALLVVNSDSFLNGHLGSYYTSLIDWINTRLPS